MIFDESGSTTTSFGAELGPLSGDKVDSFSAIFYLMFDSVFRTNCGTSTSISGNKNDSPKNSLSNVHR